MHGTNMKREEFILGFSYMAEIVGPEIEVNIQFQVLAVIFSNAGKAKG